MFIYIFDSRRLQFEQATLSEDKFNIGAFSHRSVMGPVGWSAGGGGMACDC